MDRRKKTTGKIKGMFHTSGTKHGSYSVGLTVLVIAIVIVFNLSNRTDPGSLSQSGYEQYKDL